MKDKLHTFSFLPDWMLLSNTISQVDRFDASWATIERREGQTLKQLKAIATVRSVGASTRIEGAQMTDAEVETLLKKLSISKLEERDEQEVAGYFETLELISGSYRDIAITETNLKHLHNSLMKYSKKDEWHRGDYKQHSNIVQAREIDGSRRVVFKTADPGFATQDAMSNLIAWYASDKKALPLIKVAAFVYDFLSIHPFQDGNGRLSRLLGTLLLLKQGYSWIQYISFEHEIENRKAEYYKVLMQCQRNRPGEEISPWVDFFFDCLLNIQRQLMTKLDVQKKAGGLSLREKTIYSFVENHPGSRSGEISAKLGIPLPTVKRLLAEMVQSKMLAKFGKGAGTNYTIEDRATLKKDQVMRFTNTDRRIQFILRNQSSFIEITKIVLTPLFEWEHPGEWGTVLAKNGLYVKIRCISAGETIVEAPPVSLIADPHQYQPVFELKQPINIPTGIWDGNPYKKEFPIEVTITLEGSSQHFDFDAMVIYNEA